MIEVNRADRRSRHHNGKSPKDARGTMVLIVASDPEVSEAELCSGSLFCPSCNGVLRPWGYAYNQYNKMELFEDQGVGGNLRTAKFAVAYCRVLWQSAEFLNTGEFKCQSEEPMKSFLFDVKTNYKPDLVPYLTERL